METERMMYDLISEGDLQGLKTLMDEHTKATMRLVLTGMDDQGRTPLTLACQRGHVDIVKYLMYECYADVDRYGWAKVGNKYINKATPVWWAVSKGHLNIVQLLHTRGANMNGDESQPIFILACGRGDLQIVKYLHAIGADIQCADWSNKNGLMAACYRGHYEIASYLIRKGLDVNIRAENGATALVYAVWGESAACIKLLLRCGVEVKNICFKLTPLLMIRGTEDPNMVEFVINLPSSTRSAKLEALESLGAKYVNIEIDQHRDCTNGRIQTWSDVDGEGANSELSIDSIACGHRTTLVDMEQLGNEAEEMRVDALLIRKPVADCQMPVPSCFVQHFGYGVQECCYEFWLFAVEMQKKSAVSVSELTKSCLLRTGNMLISMVCGRQPVEFEVIMAVFVVAVREFEAEMCHTTTEHIAYFDELTPELMFSIYKVLPTLSVTQAQLFHQVVHKFVGLNPRDYSGETPLHSACAEGEYDVVKSLLEHGADPEAINKDRYSPLHTLARIASCAYIKPVRHDLMKLLLSYGAHFDAKNSYGKGFNDILPVDKRFDPFDYVSLKCLAAASVVKNSIPYESQVSRELADFIKLH